MKNKLLCHIIIDISIASGLLLLDELRRKRKEIKKLNQKLDETKSSIQGIEIEVELINDSLKLLSSKEI